ncbi:MAG: hypothetical protein ACI9HK_005234, partial [Pirellulaceae bacterium]
MLVATNSNPGGRLAFYISSVVTFLAILVVPFSNANGGSYETHIRPFLTKFCVSCHGPEKQKAKLRLDTLDPDMLHGSDVDMWQEALDLINLSEMPPED